MIVQESDTLMQALDRRLQIDRVLALDPLAAVSGKDGGSGSSRSAGAASTSAADGAQQTSLAARLPLGRVVLARIVDVPDAGHVVADIERWRVSMAWPRGAGSLLRPGQDITLRVLAHKPMLLFQGVDAAGEPLDADGNAAPADAPTRWSSSALELSSRAVAMSSTSAASSNASSTSRDANGAIRFTEPIIEVEIVSLAANDDVARTADAKPSVATQPTTRSSTTDRISLDDVIVARSASPPSTMPTSSPTMPIVLQGPAWAGQPMELVVRRERADDELDNPVLDHWCGEIVIDLPQLGRVSGHLAFSMQGLRIRLEGEDAATVAAMSAATASLAAALADADLRVQALSVGQPGARATAGASSSIDPHG